MCDCTEPSAATDVVLSPTKRVIFLSWTPPTGQNITAYQVELKGPTTTQKAWAAEPTTVFHDVLPGKTYKAVVTPVIGNTLGEPVEVEFTTSKSFVISSFCVHRVNTSHFRMLAHTVQKRI